MSDKIIKIFSLDKIYFFLAVFLVAYIIKWHNILDVVYLCLVTFYYIKIKFYRWQKYH